MSQSDKRNKPYLRAFTDTEVMKQLQGEASEELLQEMLIAQVELLRDSVQLAGEAKSFAASLRTTDTCLERAMTLVKARAQLVDLFAVWLGERGFAENVSFWGYYPRETLSERYHQSVRQLLACVSITGAKKRTVNLGNFWPREAQLQFVIAPAEEVELSFEYTNLGPMSRASESMTSLVVFEYQKDNGKARTLFKCVGNEWEFDRQTLSHLKDVCLWEQQEIFFLRCLLMICECQYFREGGGMGAVSSIFDSLSYLELYP